MTILATDRATGPAALGSAGDTKGSSAIKDQFLKLLVTQLTNQDPLNPLDNAQLTSQLAQISTVESMEKLNSTVAGSLATLRGQIAQGQSLQFTALIGKEVLIPGNRILLGTNPDDPTMREATPFGIDFQAPAAKVKITIADAIGNVVRTIELGAQPVGVATLAWDGMNDDGAPVPDGAYSATMQATDGAGVAQDAAAMLSYGKISGVAYGSDGIQLDLGTAGQVGLNSIVKVF